jgi:integrase
MATGTQSPPIEYLQALARVAPSTTVTSHRVAIRQFESWHPSSIDTITAQAAAAYAEAHPPEYSLNTLRGHLSTLANCIAYYRTDDPELASLRIASHLPTGSSVQPQLIELRDALDLDDKPTPVEQAAVNLLLAHLRQSQFGSLPHVTAELILETNARLSVIRDINCSDVDCDTRSVTVSIPETHAITTDGFLDTRRAEISQRSVTALQAYLTHERTPTDHDPDPLFTTAYGRVSTDTIRRVIKEASETALSVPTIKYLDHSISIPTSTVAEQVESLTPGDIRRHAAMQITT